MLKKRAVRLVAGMSQMGPFKQAFKDLTIFNLPCIFIFEAIIYYKFKYMLTAKI